MNPPTGGSPEASERGASEGSSLIDPIPVDSMDERWGSIRDIADRLYEATGAALKRLPAEGPEAVHRSRLAFSVGAAWGTLLRLAAEVERVAGAGGAVAPATCTHGNSSQLVWDGKALDIHWCRECGALRFVGDTTGQAWRLPWRGEDRERVAFVGEPSDRPWHFAAVPFTPLCGSNEKGEGTTDGSRAVTCEACRALLKSRALLDYTSADARKLAAHLHKDVFHVREFLEALTGNEYDPAKAGAPARHFMALGPVMDLLFGIKEGRSR